MKIKTQEIKKKVLKTLKLKNQKKSGKNEEEKEKPLFEDDPIDSDDNESLDSDQELQLAFARKELTPGLNIQLIKPKEFKNDKDGMERKLKSIFLNMDWVERMDVTVRRDSMKKLEKQFNELENTENGGESQDLANNDFKRESIFLKQAELAVIDSLPKLEVLKIKTKRPEDYFAEMAKSDDQMKRVREHLLSKHAELEKRDKIRKLRELKKMGKSIQVEALKKKEQAKKSMNDKVNRYKKGDKSDNLEILLEEDGDKKSAKRSDEKKSGPDDKKKPGKKTKLKEQKYGFGGRKKRGKYNTAESYAEAFKNPVKNSKKGNKSGGGGGGGKVNKKFVNKNKPKSKR